MKLFLNKKKVLLVVFTVLISFFNLDLFAQTCVPPSTPSYAWPTHSKWFFGEGNLLDFGASGSGSPSSSSLPTAGIWDAGSYESRDD